jgi:hypothetical protein
MDYQQNELGLRQLLRGLESVPDTHPPIYMLDGILIGYDKLDRIAVIAAEKNTSVQTKWLEKALKALTRPIRGSHFSSRAKILN